MEYYLEIIYLLYEWCFAILAIILHKKIKEKGSLFLCVGITTLASLWILELIGKSLSIKNPLFSYIIPAIMACAPILTLSGLAMLVFNWEGIIKKQITNQSSGLFPPQNSVGKNR